MPISTALQQTVETLRNALPAEIFNAIGQSITDLKETGIEAKAPKIGDRITLPVLEDADGGHIDLAGLAQTGHLVISYYRGGWCPYCSVELRGLSAVADRLKQQGVALVAISPETPENAGETSAKNALGFPVAVDRGNHFARSLGIVFPLPENLRPLYRQIGIDLASWNGDDSHELPLPLQRSDASASSASQSPRTMKRVRGIALANTVPEADRSASDPPPGARKVAMVVSPVPTA